MRSTIVQLSSAIGTLQLGGAHGFVLWPASDDPTAPFPVVLRLREKDGNTVDLLVRPGIFYRRNEATSVAQALQLGGTAAGNRYQLDLFEEGEEAQATPPRAATRMLWDSGVVAGGVIINSPVLDLSQVSALLVICRNDDGAATRNLSFQAFLEDGVTQLFSALVGSASAASTKTTAFGLGAAVGGGGSAVPGYSVPGLLPPRASFILTSNGAAQNGRMTIFQR